MNDGTYRSLCGLCHMGCGIIATVENGKVTQVKGDPAHPGSKGRLCPKAASIPEIITSPDRLKMPLIRRSRSEELHEVSWEEALDFAAERLAEIKEKYGPRGLIRCKGAPVNYESRDGFKQFMIAYGSDNETGAANLCSVPRATGYSNVIGAKTEPDPFHTNLFIYWGSNPMASTRMGGFCSFDMPDEVIRRLKERGVKIIAVDPICSETARRADEWIQLKCGSDSALLLAMMNHIIENDLYDHEFVVNYTEGFDKFREHVKQFPPEWAAPITGLSAEKIRSFAEEYATANPASIADGNGTDMYANVVDTSRLLAMIQGLCGYLDIFGGNMFLPFIPQKRMGMKPSPDRFGKKQFPFFPEIPFTYFKESILSGEPSCPKAMIVMHANPALVQANCERTKEALGKLELLIVNDIFMTATAELADIVFPDVSPFERYSYRAYSSYDKPFAGCGRPLADPPGQARCAYETEYALAKRLGIEDKYEYHDDIGNINCMLSPSGITFEQLEREQYCFMDAKVEEKKYAKSGTLPNGGKMLFYNDKFEAAGLSPMPIYRKPSNAEEKISDTYPLLGTNLRPLPFVHTKLHNMKATTGIHPYSELWISPKDAAARKIDEGDFALVLTDKSEGRFIVKIMDKQPEGLIAAEFGWGNPTDSGPSLNSLSDDVFSDPVAGSTPNRLFACQVIKVYS